jgi:thiopeptide-type bacteriocin biosynthesis protein
MERVIRNFTLGSEWLFYKIYVGPKTGDALLTQAVKPLVYKLVNDSLVEKWFFIRYTDPNFHIRLRLRLMNKEYLGKVIDEMYKCLQPWIKNEFVWNIQLDTYQRELERYGYNSINISESIFYYDSVAIVNFLDLIEGDEGEELRWLFGLRYIDNLLDSFDLKLEKKKELMEELKTAFGKEFGMVRFLKKQLDDKYRNEIKKIRHFMVFTKNSDPMYGPILEILQDSKELISPFVNELLELKERGGLKVGFNNLISSYIHMSMNRLFKSKNRLNEMVLYDFLYRYYRSLSAISEKKSNKIET